MSFLQHKRLNEIDFHQTNEIVIYLLTPKGVDILDNLNEHKKRSSIFKFEMLRLKQYNYINDDTFNIIKEAYDKYDQDYSKHLMNESSKKNIYNILNRQPRTKGPVSAEQIRERNISIVMIIGVLFLLLGGVILATSSWDIMSNVMKTILIFMVCFLFYGLSIVSDKVLKIHNTAYAFLSLAALFLPISILSAGYFELFGPRLSFFGEGRYILGILGGIICASLYATYAIKTKSKMFVWFAIASASISAIYLMLQTKSSDDIFYLGMFLYCSLLMLFYYKFKDDNKYDIFTKELIRFVPIITSLFTFLSIINRDSSLKGFHIMLYSTVFLALMFATKTKKYSIVFSLLMTYGMFIFIHFNFKSIEYLLFPLIGVFFIGIERLFRKDEYLEKLFRFVSGIATIITFLQIFINSLSRHNGYSSCILLISYLILFINMTYVSYVTKEIIFKYIAPVFLMSAVYQSYLILDKFYLTLYNQKSIQELNLFGIYMFIISAIIFYFLYYKNNYKFTLHLKTGSLVTSVGMMYISLLSTWFEGEYLTLGLWAIILSILFFLSMKQMNKEYKIKAFLYSILFNINFVVIGVISYNVTIRNAISWQNIMVITSFIILIVWYLVKDLWKDRVSLYLAIFGIISQYQFGSIQPFGNIQFVTAILVTAAILYILHKRNWGLYSFIPFIALIFYIIKFSRHLEQLNVNKTLIVLFLGVILILLNTVGTLISKELYRIKGKFVSFIDWYFITSLFICPVIANYTYKMSIVYRIIPELILTYLLFTQVRRIPSIVFKRIIISLGFISLLLPYHTIIGEYMDRGTFYYSIAYYLPIIFISELIINKAWKNMRNQGYKVQFFIAAFIFFRLLIATGLDNTGYSIIYGILAIISIIAGMQFKLRCYFFIGIAALVINVLIQTREFWGSLPWWAYLIISGSVLIGLASYNEWLKKNEKKLMKSKIFDKFKDWL